MNHLYRIIRYKIYNAAFFATRNSQKFGGPTVPVVVAPIDVTEILTKLNLN